jgi:hypothetical protein
VCYFASGWAYLRSRANAAPAAGATGATGTTSH